VGTEVILLSTECAHLKVMHLLILKKGKDFHWFVRYWGRYRRERPDLGPCEGRSMGLAKIIGGAFKELTFTSGNVVCLTEKNP